MEMREWAVRILSGDSLEEKLLYPETLTDIDPGTPLFWKSPTRPQGMEFKKHSRKERLPHLGELTAVDKRAVCLHRFAGHELLAVEIMAYAILAFPEAPRHFRRGLANTLIEEQEHVRLYIKRLEAMSTPFGSMPLYKHFWSYVPFLSDPIKYVSVMSLTFEMANLDFAPLYRQAFALHGDAASAELMDRIVTDEISHVSFGYHWLEKMKKSEQSSWQAWRCNVPENLPLKRARGAQLQEELRLKAKIPTSWVEEFKKV
jgi:uncharacterized ferritin-like protein (DUF455 family)